MTNLKDDLIYKGVSDPFFIPVSLNKGEECSTDSVINAIIKEDATQSCTSKLSPNMFENIKDPMKKMLENVDNVANDFQEMVNKTARSRESGRSVGWTLEMHMKKLFLQDLVGGRKNKENLLKNFKKSLLFGKEDVIPASHLMDKLEIKTVVWLKTQKSPRLKHCLFRAVIKWLWRLAKRLVAFCYYVSDTQSAPNQLTYIPKRVWKAETDRVFNSLSHLQPLNVAEAQQLAAVRNPAKLRWMPKSKGLRPIMYIRGDKTSSFTIKAKDLVLCLVNKHALQVNTKWIHGVWRELIDHTHQRKYYFIACDIHDAFGSVKQDKVIEIIEEEIDRKFGSHGKTKFANEIAAIKNAVKCQTVKKMRKSYHLIKGLAQGMPLSGPLCNLYLSHLDRTSLAYFTYEPDDRLIRAVDDYLYITPSREKAQRFLNVMKSGFDDYGVKINPLKTQTNLDGDLEILYHGYLFNTANLEVYVRYNQGINVSFRNSIVFKVAPILLLEKKLVKTLHNKLNQLTVDRCYMSVEGVIRNLMHTGCLLARWLTAILSLSCTCDVPENSQLADLIKRSAESVAQRVCKIRASLERDVNTMNPSKIQHFNCLRKEEIKWVVLRAFSMILTRAAPMKKTVPDDLVMMVCELEEAIKTEVHSQVIGIVNQVFKIIPHQFRNVDED